MVRFNLPSNHQPVLLLQHRHNMMEHHLQQHYQPSTSPVLLQRSAQEGSEPDCRARRIQCVYLTDAKPANSFSLAVHNTEAAALCTSSSNLPVVPNGSNRDTNLSSCGAASSSSPTGTPSPASSSTNVLRQQQQQHTPFMISDILDSSTNTRSSNARTCSSASSTGTALDEGRTSCCEDLPNGRDSPRSTFSDDVDCKEEREKREDSLGASDSDTERPNQTGVLQTCE